MPRFPTRPFSKALARSLRRSMTPEEMRLWWFLRDRTDVKWRRQEPLGQFIVDFLCYPARLVVEVDGSQHADSAYDRRRDQWLRDQGFRVLRVTNRQVNQDIEYVMASILEALA